MNFDFERQTDAEKADRLVQKFSSILRTAKTAAVSGRTTVEIPTASGGCSDYAIQASEEEIATTALDFSETGSISKVCGVIPDMSLFSPLFSESDAYKILAMTAYDKNDVVLYRIADAADFGGRLPVGFTGTSVAVLVDGSNLRAVPAGCGNASCLDFSSAYSNAVKVKFHVSYGQGYGVRDASKGKDVFLDVRTGNITVKKPVSP